MYSFSIVTVIGYFIFITFNLKGKGSFYIAEYPSPGSILAMQQLRAATKSLTFPPLSIAKYSFIQLSQLGLQWGERKCQIFEKVPKGGSEPGLT